MTHLFVYAMLRAACPWVLRPVAWVFKNSSPVGLGAVSGAVTVAMTEAMAEAVFLGHGFVPGSLPGFSPAPTPSLNA